MCSNHAEISVVVAEDQEQVDKILSLKDGLPHLKLVIYDDPRGMRYYDEPSLKSFDAVQAAGRDFGAAHPGYLEARDRQRRTRRSGAARLHLGHDLAAQGRDAVARQPATICRGVMPPPRTSAPSDELLSLSADGVDRRLAVFARAQSCWSDSPATARSGRRRCSAICASSARRSAFAPPRIWESMLSSVRVRAADSTPLKRKMFDFFQRAGRAGGAAQGEANRCRRWRRLGLRARRGPGLRAVARSVGPRPRPLVLYRRRAARCRHLSVLSLDRHQRQAGLGRHRALRSRYPAAGRRGEPRYGRPGLAGHRAAHRRGRRGAGPLARRCSRAITNSRKPPETRSARMAGCSTGDSGFLDRAAIW